MFWILFLFFSTLAAESSPSAIAHFESGLPSVAGGYVNVITGAPLIHVNDLVIPGIEPLTLSRDLQFNPEGIRQNLPGIRKGWNLHFQENLTREDDETGDVYLSQHVDAQPMFGFFFPKGSKEELLFYDVNKSGKGSTNIGHGYPSGRHALKNIYLKESLSSPGSNLYSATIVSGDRETRSYWSEKDKYSSKIFAPLQLIVSPSGFEKVFTWKNSLVLSKISLLSPTKKTITELMADEKNDLRNRKIISFSSNEGRQVTFHFDGLNLIESETSDHPNVKYGYQKKRLETISWPESRGVKFSYWENNDRWVDQNGKTGKLSKYAQLLQKVKTIEQPVGPTQERIATHLFQYFQDDRKDPEWNESLTRVILSEGHIDDYIFDHEFLLKEIRHYTNPEKAQRVDFPAYPLKHTCDFKEQFFWNPNGEVREKRHSDARGKALRSIKYKYDTKGNVLKETFKGDISGTGFEEEYVKVATYSDDGFNLLLSETLPSGLEVRYEYLSGTNLLSKRTTCYGKEIFREETFTYDDDHCLLLSEEKTANVHRIEKITSSKKVPFGYPLTKEIFAVGRDGEELQESYYYKYNARGDIISEERRDRNHRLIYAVKKKFDLHGNCLEEQDSLERHITRKFDDNDNCIEETGPREGMVKTKRYDFMNRCVEEILTFEGETWAVHHAYNHFGYRTKTTDFLGNTTETEYDRYGRPLKVTLPKVLVNGQLKAPLLRKKHDPFGNEIESTDPLGHKTFSKFTARNKISEITHPDGTRQSIVYSLESLPLTITDEEGVVTTFTYDVLGRILSKTTPHGEEIYRYKGLHLVEKIDMEKSVTTYSYDLLGRLQETTTGKRREVISYDEMGHPFKKFHYEDEKLLSIEVSKIDPLGRTLETFLEDTSGAIFNHKQFVYDMAGNCIEEWNGKSKIRRTFDGLNRVTKVVDEEGNIHRVIYRRVEHNGLTVEEKCVIDPNLQQMITLYNTLGKEVLIRHLSPFGEEIYRREISYDLAGHIVKEETKSPTEKRTLLKEVDSMGRVISLIEPLKKITRMKYTPCGNLEVLTKPDGVKLTHFYVEGRLESLMSSDGQLYYTYGYNHRGEMTEAVDQLTGLKSLQSYSSLGELIKETLPTGEVISYTYDGLAG